LNPEENLLSARICSYKTFFIVFAIAMLFLNMAFIGLFASRELTSDSDVIRLYADLVESIQTITHGHERSSLYALLSSLKNIVGKIKKLCPIESNSDLAKGSAAQNDGVAILVILLFAIFYLLSRTCSEKPAASHRFTKFFVVEK
jgi:hypothetical protein